MPIKYEYDPILNILHNHPYGELSISEIQDYFRAILNDDEIKAEFIEVVHFENIEKFLFSSNEVSTITEAYSGFKDKKKVRATIFVGASDLQFGIARMLETFHEIQGPDDKIYVVNSKEKANEIIKKITC